MKKVIANLRSRINQFEEDVENPVLNVDYADLGNSIGLALGKTLSAEELTQVKRGMEHGLDIMESIHG
jgi:hypothetical protein